MVTWNNLETLQEGEKQEGVTEFCKGKPIMDPARAASCEPSGYWESPEARLEGWVVRTNEEIKPVLYDI